MECIDAGPREEANDSSPFFRVGREPRAIILLLPGRQPQHHREIRPDIGADLLNDLDGEAGSVADVAAILVLAQVGLIPEKLIDEVAMRAVNFDAVKAQRLCGARGSAVGLYYAANFVKRRWPPHPFERQTVPSDDAGRTEAVVTAGTTVIETPHAVDLRLADEPDVPELREDPASRVVHLLNHAAPSVERVIAVDAGSVFIVSRAGMRDERTFGNDEADTALGSPPVIAGDILIRHAAGRHGAGHWGHRDAVVQFETTDPGRLEQDFERVRYFHLDGGHVVLLRREKRHGVKAPFSNAPIDDTFRSINASMLDT